MTVTYSLKVSNATFGSFSRLLFMWKGSIYKLIWKELFVFLVLYYLLSVIYRFALTNQQAETFEMICFFFKDRLLGIIPLSFILGFYVSVVIGRWWGAYRAIPWTDSVAQLIAAHIRGDDEETRKCRRTLIRWLNLTTTIVFTSVSVPVLKRFPTIGHLVNAGLMTKEERKLYENLKTPYTKYWLPITWACNLVTRLRDEGKIKDDITQNMLLERIQAHRGSCGGVLDYDWISVPLVYSQVVTIATYTYFLAKLFADQFLNSSAANVNEQFPVDFYFPVLTFLEFFFYFGWLKVAEAIINPYGDDDDDFELNFIIDRSYQVGLLIVDDLCDKIPTIEKDAHWGIKEFELPFTETTAKRKILGSGWLFGSTYEVILKTKDFIIAVPGHLFSFGRNSTVEPENEEGEHTEMKPMAATEQPGTDGKDPEKPIAAATAGDRIDETDSAGDGLLKKRFSKKQKSEVVRTPSGAMVKVAGEVPPDVSDVPSGAQSV